MNKKIFAAIITGGIFLFAGCMAQGNIFPYPFKTLKIEVKHSGTTEGTTMFTIKGDSSVREAHLVTKVLGQEEKEDTLSINKGEWMYIINLNEKTGIKLKNPVYAELKDRPKEERMNYLNELAIGLSPAMSMPESVESKEFEGYTCNVYKVENQEMELEACLWNSITLFANIKLPDPPIESAIEVVSMEVDGDVSEETFQIPEGIEIVEGQQ